MAYGTTNVDTIQSSTTGTPVVFKDGSGTQIGTLCRAWVNFNGTGTVAIRGSFNVSSITDNGTGDYTVNFTNAMPDANYAASAAFLPDSVGFGNSIRGLIINTYSTSSMRVQMGAGNPMAAADFPTVDLSFFR